MKNIFKASIALASIALLAGCTAAPGTPGAPAATETPTPTPTPVFVTAPLTGMQYEETTAEALALARPSVACKIDNSEAARPQQGLNATDVVYVEMVEGGLTRLVAMWHSTQPDAVGPVRSIRPMDPDIISSYGGIVCYSGGQYVFVKQMEKAPVFNASETSEQENGTFSRSKDRYAPHNVIVNVAKLATNHPELTAPQPHFNFATDLASTTAATTGTAVIDFKVGYPSALSAWAPTADGTAWLRSQDKKAHKDSATGEQIKATNVLVMQVKIDRGYLDRKYGNIPKTIMVSSGKGWVFTAGKYIEVTWSKTSATSPITLTALGGAPVGLAPGNTWIELMPAAPEGKITINKVPVASPSPTP